MWQSSGSTRPQAAEEHYIEKLQESHQRSDMPHWCPPLHLQALALTSEHTATRKNRSQTQSARSPHIELSGPPWALPFLPSFYSPFQILLEIICAYFT